MLGPNVLDPKRVCSLAPLPQTSPPPLHPSRRATTLLTRPSQVVTAAGKKLGAAELDRIAAEGANNETKRLVALGRGVAQSAWEASVGRIAKERNVTMGEATGDFATQTGEAQADFDSSFGACEAEKNRTSVLVANDQAFVAPHQVVDVDAHAQGPRLQRAGHEKVDAPHSAPPRADKG